MELTQLPDSNAFTPKSCGDHTSTAQIVPHAELPSRHTPQGLPGFSFQGQMQSETILPKSVV